VHPLFVLSAAVVGFCWSFQANSCFDSARVFGAFQIETDYGFGWMPGAGSFTLVLAVTLHRSQSPFRFPAVLLGFMHGYRWIAHDGDSLGHHSVTAWFPELDFSIFLTTTGENPDSLAAIRYLAQSFIIDAFVDNVVPWANVSNTCGVPSGLNRVPVARGLFSQLNYTRSDSQVVDVNPAFIGKASPLSCEILSS
jgi:hypothetical protein